jgi:hypothetical protein
VIIPGRRRPASYNQVNVVSNPPRVRPSGKRWIGTTGGRLHVDVRRAEALRDTLVVMLVPGEQIHEGGRRKHLLVGGECDHRGSGRPRGVVKQPCVQHDRLADGGSGELRREWCVQVAVEWRLGFALHWQVGVQAGLDRMAISTYGDGHPRVLRPLTPRGIELVGFDALIDGGGHRLGAHATMADEPFPLDAEIDELVALVEIAEGIVDRHRVAPESRDGAVLRTLAGDLHAP